MTYIHTTPWAVYNEFDEYAADWLENLIAAGLIANGIVDRRSIVDVRPDDYRGFRQVHLFAGIGVWSYAFRRAGVSDDTALWSLSCPCQPFSAAGKGAGVDDERHLWPHAHHLIRERRPAKIYGEQVASKDGLAWLDIVQTDMEGTGYAFGAVDTCSASVGAPHIRQRLRFHAYDLRSSSGGLSDAADIGLGDSKLARRLADSDRHEPWQGRDAGSAQGEGVRSEFGGCRQSQRMVNTDGARSSTWIPEQMEWEEGNSGFHDNGSDRLLRSGKGQSEIGGLVDPDCCGTGEKSGDYRKAGEKTLGRTGANDSASLSLRAGSTSGMADTHDGQLQVSRRGSQGRNGSATVDAEFVGTGPTNGFWRDADWLFCRDGRWRPVEPGTFPLAHGAASRVGRLRAYGNAVDAEATREFIEATLEHETLDLEAAATLFEDVLG